MKYYFVSFFILFIGFFSPVIVLGQSSVAINLTIPSITLMDIEPSAAHDITLTYTVPTEAGNPVVEPTNSSDWINYSSCLAPGFSNKIMVQISTGTVPAGMSLKLQAAAFSGTGAGVFGTSAGQITLTGTPTAIINSIGGSHTDNGINNGHQLTYSLMITNYSLLRYANTPAITVVYTMITN